MVADGDNEDLEAIFDRLHVTEELRADHNHLRLCAIDDVYPAEDPGVTTGSDDVAFLMYTSGTTGSPKGVMLSNNNYFSKAAGIADKWRFDADSVSLAVMPTFHMAGSGWALVGLYEGCTTVVLRDVDSPAILDAVARHRITNMLLVPAVIQMLLATPGVAGTDFSSVRAIVYGASPITDDVLESGRQRLPGRRRRVRGQGRVRREERRRILRSHIRIGQARGRRRPRELAAGAPRDAADHR